MNAIKKSTLKLIKGISALFMLKVLLFSIVVVLQSCQEEDDIYDDFEVTLALEKFESVVLSSSFSVKSVIEKYEGKNDANLSDQSNNENYSNEMGEALKPLINGTQELLTVFDFTESDMPEEFKNWNDPKLAIVGLAILASSKNQGRETAMNFANLMSTPMYAQDVDWGEIGRCAATAIGADLLWSLGAESSAGAWSKKALGKLFKKVAARFLGPIGVGIAVVSFGLCMYA